ncbi:hypothetical protein WDZ11_22535 (plasmid) [Roseomonas mucosa]|uniref:hypothetical protein n=1 Tax=Roseomonas mucosa TaxID=207340 RepID=UPI0030CE4490
MTKVPLGGQTTPVRVAERLLVDTPSLAEQAERPIIAVRAAITRYIITFISPPTLCWSDYSGRRASKNQHACLHLSVEHQYDALQKTLELFSHACTKEAGSVLL